jgi:hypothetical protein
MPYAMAPDDARRKKKKLKKEKSPLAAGRQSNAKRFVLRQCGFYLAPLGI